MTQSRIGRTFRLTLISSTLALALSACGSSGSTRIGAIGDVPPGSGGNTGNGDTGGGNTGNGDTGGGNTGGGNTGGGNTGGGNSGGGNTGGTPSSIPLAGPVLVTAGNTVIGLGDKHAGLAERVNGKLPAAGLVTGTVTAVLRKSGQTLVDLGNGQSAVLNRAGGAVGKLVTIDLGSGRVVGAPGATGLIGVAALTLTQVAGVSVANPAAGVTTGALGKVGTIVSGTTGAVTDAIAGGLGGPSTGPTPQPAVTIPGVTGTIAGSVAGSVSGGTPTVTAPGTGLLPGTTTAVTDVLGKAKRKLGK